MPSPMIRQANELVYLRPIASVPGKPEWMNLRATPLLPPDFSDLRGPGIYGLFLDDRLFYVGVYAGRRHEPFAGSALHLRWHMHVTYHTLRSPMVTFRAEQMNRILRELDGPVSSAFAQMLGGREVDCRTLDPAQHPLLGSISATGRQEGCCTINKVAFAERNWTVLGPNGPGVPAIAERISIVYMAAPDEWERLVPPAPQPHAAGWVKNNWLFPIEDDLIKSFRPLCNTHPSVTLDNARNDVTRDLFIDALSPLLEQAPPVATALKPAPATAKKDMDITDDPLSGAFILDPVADDELSEPDNGGVSHDMDADAPAILFLSQLQDGCPETMEVYRTGRDVRLALRAPRRRPLLTLSPTREGYRCNSRAPVVICRLLGFDADAASAGSGMASSFVVDPVRHAAGTLLAVSGAALAADRAMDVG
jgi:hypothetical protein